VVVDFFISIGGLIIKLKATHFCFFVLIISTQKMPPNFYKGTMSKKEKIETPSIIIDRLEDATKKNLTIDERLDIIGECIDSFDANWRSLSLANLRDVVNDMEEWKRNIENLKNTDPGKFSNTLNTYEDACTYMKSGLVYTRTGIYVREAYANVWKECLQSILNDAQTYRESQMKESQVSQMDFESRLKNFVQEYEKLKLK
jgi:hypothetical protein